MRLENDTNKKLKRRGVKFLIASLATTAHLGLIKAEIAFANSLDFLEGKGNGTFDKPQAAVEQTGASLYSFIKTVGTVGLIISIVMVGLSFSSKNANKREESKNQFLWIAVAAIVIFGSMTILGIFASIGSGLTV